MFKSARNTQKIQMHMLAEGYPGDRQSYAQAVTRISDSFHFPEGTGKRENADRTREKSTRSGSTVSGKLAGPSNLASNQFSDRNPQTRYGKVTLRHGEEKYLSLGSFAGLMRGPEAGLLMNKILFISRENGRRGIPGRRCIL
jgi:hypothetical protein